MNTIKSLISPYRGLPKEIYVIFISRIINSIGSFVMPLMTLILTEKIGLRSDEAGLFISLAGLAFIIPSIIGGKLADTIGRKKVIIFFNFFSILTYIACSFMKPTITMGYMIVLAGAFMTIAGPAHDSLIADLTNTENRTSSYALCYIGLNLGFAFGPALGGLLYKNHLPWIFIGNAISGFLSLILIAFFIKETLDTATKKIYEESKSLEKPEEGSILSVLIRRPVLIYFSLIILGYNFSYSQFSFMLPIHVSQNFTPELGGKYFGMISSFNGLIVILFTSIVAKLFKNVKDMKSMILGGLLYAIGFGMLAFFSSLGSFFVSVFILTIGEIVLAISVTPFIINHTPSSHRGRMSAVLPIITGAGRTIGPMVMGKVIAAASIETGWLIVGGVAASCSVLMLLLERISP